MYDWAGRSIGRKAHRSVNLLDTSGTTSLNGSCNLETVQFNGISVAVRVVFVVQCLDGLSTRQ
jgi:hypothetical protein